MQLYKVRLQEGHTAKPNQNINGYLASYQELGIYTRGEALKKAMAFGGKIEKHGKNYSISKTTVINLDGNDLSKTVKRELKEREVYTDPEDETNEPIYYGDVFATILGEHLEQTLLSFNQDVIDELIVLDNICANYEYVRIM
jgi:hypothetical protein